MQWCVSRTLAFTLALVLTVFGPFAPLAPRVAMAYVTDTLTHEPPTSGTYAYDAFKPGAMGFPAAGGSYVDPVFNESVRRLTNEFQVQSDDEIYSKNGFYNASGTLMYHRAPNSMTSRGIIKTSDGTIVCSGLPAPAFDSSFDPVDPSVWYYFSGTQILSYTVNESGCTPNPAPVKTFAETVGPLGGSVDWIDASGRYMVLNLNGNIKLYDKVADQVYGGGAIDFNFYTGDGDGWVGLSPDAKYIVTAKGNPDRLHYSFAIDHVNKTVNATGTLFWTLCGAHGDLVSASDGKTYYVGLNCYDGQPAVYRVDVTLPQTAANWQQQLAQNRALFNTTWSDDVHVSGAATGTLKDWVFVSTENGNDVTGAMGTWYPYKQEIVMANVVTLEVRRLAHHRSRGIAPPYYFRSPRVSASWDGGHVAWASNFGYDGSPDYADIYMIDIAGGSGGGGGGLTSENVVWTSTANVQVNGNTITKNAGCEGCWDAGGISQQTIASGDGYVEFTATPRATAGLSTGNTGQSADEIKWGLRFYPDNSVEVRESGVYKSGWMGAAGDLYRVSAESGAVKYYRNGTLVYTSDVAPTYPLLLDATIETVTASIQSAVIARASSGPHNVTWTSTANVQVNGNTITKNAGCDGCWDAGGISQQTIASGDGYVEFTATPRATAGLSTGNTGQSADEIKWGLRFYPDNSVEVRESGVYKSGWMGAAGDLYRVSSESGVVKYYRNGTLMYTSQMAATYPLLLDATIETVGASIQNAVISGAQ